MAQIMHHGMTGYKIADLFNDANRKYNFYKHGNFPPPGDLHERKESYAFRYLSELKEQGWDEVLLFIARQLLDESRAYFEEDEERPYPEQKIERLKGVLSPKEQKAERAVSRTHGRTIKALLSSIENDEIRECIYNDIRDIETCISISAWKPAVVLAGSVLEAILSDWLEQESSDDVKSAYQQLYPGKNLKKIEDFWLEELIAVAEHMGLIHGYHKTISDGIRNFRNLIHPNISIRKQITPNKSIAEIGRQIIFAILQERRKIG